MGPQFTSVQSLSHVRLFETPWISAHQASLSITNSRSSRKLVSLESVMPSNHLLLCRPLLLLSPIPPIIKVFSNESTLQLVANLEQRRMFQTLSQGNWSSLIKRIHTNIRVPTRITLEVMCYHHHQQQHFTWVAVWPRTYFTSLDQPVHL